MSAEHPVCVGAHACLEGVGAPAWQAWLAEAAAADLIPCDP